MKSRKIALCISGYLRTFKECYPSILENVIQDNDVDIFIHTYDKIRACPTYHNNDEYDRNKNYDLDLDFLENIPQLKILFVEKWEDVKHKFFDKYKNPNYHQSYYTPPIYVSPYKIYKCNELKKQYERENNFIYDLVIRTRGDQIFTKKIDYNFPKNKILINSYPFGDEDCVHKCDYQSDIVLNDRFAAGSSDNIDYLSNLYLENFFLIENLYSPLERMHYLHLENGNIEIEKRNLGFYVKHSPQTTNCRLCGNPVVVNK